MKKLLFCVLFLIVPNFVFAGEYASMYFTNQTTVYSDLGNADTWYKVTGFSEMITSADWTFDGTNDELDGDSDCAGTYMVRFSINFKADEGLWGVAIDVNGTKYGNVQKRLSSVNAFRNATGTSLIDIENLDSISLWVRSDTDPTNFEPVHCQVVLVEALQATTPYYGEMGISGNSTSQALSTSWSTLTNQTDTNANLSGWTYSNDVLTDATGTSGDYLVVVSLSFAGEEDTDYEFGISKGNNAPYAGSDDTNIVLKRTIVPSKIGDIGNASACGIINLSNTENLRLKTKTTGNYDVTVPEENVTVFKLDGTNSTPYASMLIDSSLNALTLPQGNWVKENDFQDGVRDASYWEFSLADDKLTPINLSAGYYFLNYFVSVAVETSTENQAFDGYCAIFNNSEQVANTTMIRQLQKRQGSLKDIGASSRSAIILIDNPNDTLDMRIYQNDLGSVNVSVRWANVNLFRISTVNGGTLPVELSLFVAQYLNSKAQLYWVTQSETDNIGWNVYRSKGSDFYAADRINNEIIEGYGTTSEQHEYYFTDKTSQLITGETYYYWLENLDLGGGTDVHGPAQLYVTPEEEPGIVPVDLEYDGLYNLVNNPFNPTLTDVRISFSLPINSHVSLDIYNVKGQLVRNLYSGISREKKDCAWDGTDENSIEQSSGVYLYILTVNNKIYDTQKIILMR